MGAITVALMFAPTSPRAGQEEGAIPTYRVGHTIKSVLVSGVLDPTTNTMGEDRVVQVHLWYPARNQDDCDEAADFAHGPGGCDAPLASYTSRLYGISLSPTPWSPLAWAVPARIAFENARVARGDDRFPVIVFSHGNVNNAIDYAYTFEALASHGYIVAAPDHVNNTQDDVRIDFANQTALKQGLIAPGSTVIANCLDGKPWTPTALCSHPLVSRSFIERHSDVGAVLDALPTWFGERVDMGRVGILGHSRGTVTVLAAGGGSATWGLAPFTDKDGKPRIKGLMGLAIGAKSFVQNVTLANIAVPTMLVAGSLDVNPGPKISEFAFDALQLSSTDNVKQLVIIPDAVHRHFDSTYCAEMQASGAIAQASPSLAMLDRQTVRQILQSPISGNAEDYCGYDAFTNPTDITALVQFPQLYGMTNLPGFPNLTPFTVTPSDVPTHGLTSDTVENQVVGMALCFFGQALNRDSDDVRPLRSCAPDGLTNQQPPVPDPISQGSDDDAELNANDSD